MHAHALPAESASVINAFNLSDQEREITASCTLADLGLPDGGSYRTSATWARTESGRLTVRTVLPAWGAEVAKWNSAVSISGSRRAGRE